METATSTPPLPNYDDLIHIRETVNMLCLAVCQIESSVKESNNSVDNLTGSFTELAFHSQAVNAKVQQTKDISELDSIKADVKATADEMQDNINKAVTAFQFYDRISQRLDHVARHLERVSEIIGDPIEVNSELAWKDIQDKVKNSYTMESERIMFEYIMRGASVKEALEVYNHHFTMEKNDNNEGDTDEIELF